MVLKVFLQRLICLMGLQEEFYNHIILGNAGLNKGVFIFCYDFYIILIK